MICKSPAKIRFAATLHSTFIEYDMQISCKD
uniref:Uncharacterized protein n=1 Tax=viral metagenome TaxID=1070528 RepID=A0A6C0CAU8_9ZZZZ